MKATKLRIILIVLWSLVIRYLLWPLAHLVAVMSDKTREQIAGRADGAAKIIELAKLRRQFDDCVVFFCSSAGEYEQAKPVIDRIKRNKQILCHVFFFSVSGAKFVKSRNDDVSWSVSPPDDARQWGAFFAALRPSRSVIVRHELWPAFLFAASQWGDVIVINAVVPSLHGRQAKWHDSLNLFLKSWLLKFVDLVCVVSATDVDFFEKWLKIPPNKLLVTGDTKYDRVIERAEQKLNAVSRLRDQFRNKWHPAGRDLLLIGGSVHLPDIELILAALAHQSLSRVRILLVPHDVSSSNVARMFERVRQLNFTSELLSEIENSEFKFSGEAPRVIIADELGRLSDLYGVADFAWIGGAVHAKVHNVLEPAAWALPVACGPQFQNSQEAIRLNQALLLYSADTAEVLRAHWQSAITSLDKIGAQTLAFVKNLAGASDLVLDAVFKKNSKNGGVR